MNRSGRASLPSPLRSSRVAGDTNLLVTNLVGAVLVTNSTGNCVACAAGSTWGDCPATAGQRRCLRVVVSAGGQIRMCDPALAASTPQGC